MTNIMDAINANNNLDAITMRDIIILQYGKESHEGGFAQYLFSKRPTETLRSYYNQVVKKSA